MIHRFFHADREVGDQLDRAVRSLPRVLLITQLQGQRNLALETRTPFREVLACAGAQLDLIAVIDEGRPEGMWRDPVGELCERLFPDEAAAATHGYLLVRGGRGLTWFRKALWDPLEDAEAISDYLARLLPGAVPFVRPAAPETSSARPRPSTRRSSTPVINRAAGEPARDRSRTPVMNPAAGAGRAAPSRPRAAGRTRTPVMNPAAGAAQRARTVEMPAAEAPPPPAPEPPPLDPYSILGLSPGVSYEEAKKAWRALVIQYHPDKVAHLAPEFQQLAEARTRDLNAAMALLEAALK